MNLKIIALTLFLSIISFQAKAEVILNENFESSLSNWKRNETNLIDEGKENSKGLKFLNGNSNLKLETNIIDPGIIDFWISTPKTEDDFKIIFELFNNRNERVNTYDFKYKYEPLNKEKFIPGRIEINELGEYYFVIKIENGTNSTSFILECV